MDYCERFDSWRENCGHSCLGDYESQNDNWYGLENEEEKNRRKNEYYLAKRNILSILLLFPTWSAAR